MFAPNHSRESVWPRSYLLKDVSLDTLTYAIRLVAAGGTMISAVVTERLVRGIHESRSPAENGYNQEDLTSRKAETLRLMTGGNSNREIATALDLSEGTVKNHVSNLGVCDSGASQQICIV